MSGNGVTSHEQPIDFEPAGLPFAVLQHMADAAVEVIDCMRAMHEAGSNPVNEVLRTGGDFTEWDHYPPDDVTDRTSGALYYFHAHAPGDREELDYGHFHVFMRDVVTPVGEASHENGPSHIIAISMNGMGTPVRLFTTNRWVTDEKWRDAGHVIALLDRFAIAHDEPSRVLNRWVGAMLVLFRPQIEGLLDERDRAVAQWHKRHRGGDVFEDRNLDVTSSLAIDLQSHVARLDWQMDTAAGQIAEAKGAAGDT